MASAFSGARKNRLDLSVGIALGSASQIALFVAPVLVLLSYLIGPTPIDLRFWPGAVVMCSLPPSPRRSSRKAGDQCGSSVRRRAGVDGVHDLRHDALPVTAPNLIKQADRNDRSSPQRVPRADAIAPVQRHEQMRFPNGSGG